MKKNLFIALEGIDGSGKSTQVKLLREKLEQAGLKVYTTAEPTESPIGKIIRNIFTHKMEADHRTIAGLFGYRYTAGIFGNKSLGPGDNQFKQPAGYPPGKDDAG